MVTLGGTMVFVVLQIQVLPVVARRDMVLVANLVMVELEMAVVL